MTLLLLTALSALMLQSCTYHDKIVINERHEIVIGVASAGTKSIIDNEDGSERLADMVKQCFNGNGTLKENAGFGVFGFKKVIETSSLLFENQLVHPDPTSYTANTEHPEYTDWVYSPLRFWDLTASYQFIGYWPYKPDTTIVTFHVTSVDQDIYSPVEDEDKEIVLHHIPNWQPIDGTEQDIMTATSVGRYNPDYSFFGSVRMSFHHVLSQLVIKAYYIGAYLDSTTTGGVVVQGIKLYASKDANENYLDSVLINGTTDFKQRYYDDKPVLLTKSMDADADAIDMGRMYELWYDENFKDTIAYKNELEDDPDFEPTMVKRWLMVPHRWKDLGLSVAFSMGATKYQFSEPVPVTLGAVHDDYYTLPGKTYIITLLIDSSDGAVTVQSIAVKNWVTHDVTRELYNW